MKRERPINADLPAPEAPERETPAKPEAKAPAPEKTPQRARPPRQPKPLTPKLLAALVLVAVAFIVAAVLGGTGGSDKGPDQTAPAPTGGSGSEGSESQSADELGYPAFATNNTTRIGGADPATNAAAVALAVYPATTASQRPAAVTLVSEEDWAGAIAASVLMAEPVRAPVLLSAPDEVPAATEETLEALDPTGFLAPGAVAATGGGAQAFAIGDVRDPGDLTTTAIPPGPAAREAAEIAKLRDRLFGSAPSHVLVVPSSQPQIAMPAAAWAARSGDPVLFAGVDDLPTATATALRRHTKVPVYVLGPSSAISSGVLRGIGKIAEDVKRVSGEDPVANAIAFARYGDGDFGWNVNDPGHGFVLARSDSPPDAAAAAALSGSGTWGPLLLTDSATKLPAELRSYLLDVKPGYTDNPTRAIYNHVWVIGDEERIDVNQQAEVNELAELAKIGGGG